MHMNDDLRTRMIDKFKESYKGHQGGIFTRKTKERILTGRGISGRGRNRDQFWYRHRENVKTALIDLELFIEMAGDNVNQVLTEDTVSPIARALFLHPRLDQADPDPIRAKIARLFIREGFNYLSSMVSQHVTLSHKRTIDEAIDLSNYLAMSIQPQKSDSKKKENKQENEIPS